MTGATGKVGRNLVSELVEAGVPVRALVRDPARAGLPDGVDVVRGDLTRPETLPPALDGVDTVFLLWPIPSADGVGPVLDLVEGHARRIVYLSTADMPHDEEPRDGEIFHATVERRIRRSALRWTFLRPGGFAANTLMWADQIRAGDVVRWPYGAAGRSLIDERDIAAAAARVLTTEGHDGAAYHLTGPETLTQAAQVRVIGEVLGRDVRWEEIPSAQAREEMVGAGWPASFADSALAAWAGMVDAPEPVTDTVERLTGRPARSFRTWAAGHAAAFG